MSDYDDPIALTIASALHKLDYTKLKGVNVTGINRKENVHFVKGLLNSFGLNDVPVVEGTEEYDPNDWDKERLEITNKRRDVMMSNSENTNWQRYHQLLTKLDTSKIGDTERRDHLQLCSDIFDQAKESGKKVIRVITTGLQTLDTYLQDSNRANKFKENTLKIINQGGIKYENNSLVPNENARNMYYNINSSKKVLKYIKENKIPINCWTKNSAIACSMNGSFLIELSKESNKGIKIINELRESVDAHQFWNTLNPKGTFSKSFFTTEMFLKYKTTLPDEKISEIANEFKKKYGEKSNDQVTMDDYEEYFKDYKKVLGNKSNLIIYDALTILDILDQNLKDKLQLSVPYEMDQDPELEKYCKVFGKTPSNPGLNVKNTQDVIIALTKYAVHSSSNERSKI
ncbi:uncharacterized protein I206_101818 [Kwoniella pini CBS 10737]|uniref:Inosine/uridine-preferring nucleoside hydrolase domain-containing protein n=1 Tax=Kwoniella pini CBS 10737 TaxID=1296096 RepID=A0A1B9HVM3_9TREE|nr:uncharacterized protein I206_07092 [Kwoniella pini CBS 10737]OCF47313.1 hypothetical protein I206_07092 [Kwoniella pini CBS 10737]